MIAIERGKVFTLLVSIACCYCGLSMASAQNPERSLEQGLILYMPLNGDLSDRLGNYHGRGRRGGSPTSFSVRSLFDRFSESVILEEKRQWVELDRGVDLIPFEEGF